MIILIQNQFVLLNGGDLIINRIKTRNHIIDINIISDTKREISFK